MKKIDINKAKDKFNDLKKKAKSGIKNIKKETKKIKKELKKVTNDINNFDPMKDMEMPDFSDIGKDFKLDLGCSI